MIIGHLPAGYFLTRYLIKRQKLPLTKFWLALGLIAAILPDFDYAYWLITNDQAESHRGYITAYPFLYFFILLISLLFYFYNKSKQFKNILIIIFANIFLHFILDTIFYGVHWFYPVCNQIIGVFNITGYGNNLGFQIEHYYSSWYWYLEIILWLTAITSIALSYRKGEYKGK